MLNGMLNTFLAMPVALDFTLVSKGRLRGPNSMNFRKTSEGGRGGDFRSEKLCCAFFGKGKAQRAPISRKKRNIVFQK